MQCKNTHIFVCFTIAIFNFDDTIISCERKEIALQFRKKADKI